MCDDGELGLVTKRLYFDISIIHNTWREGRDESSFIFNWHSHCTHTGKKLLFKIEEARKWKMHIWSNRMSKLLRSLFRQFKLKHRRWRLLNNVWLFIVLSHSSLLTSEDLIQLWHINIKGVPVIYQINFAPLQSIIQWVLWKYCRKFLESGRLWKLLFWVKNDDK